jgi:hypothetical protein
LAISLYAGLRAWNFGSIHELRREKKAIMLTAEFDSNAFSAVQDELDYAYAVKKDKEKKRACASENRRHKRLEHVYGPGTPDQKRPVTALLAAFPH